MPKIAGLRVPSVAAQQQAHIDQLMHQAQRLKAEVVRLEAELDAARKAARAWKRAAKDYKRVHDGIHRFTRADAHKTRRELQNALTGAK